MRSSNQLRWLSYSLSRGQRGSSHFEDLIEDDCKRTARIVDALILGLDRKPRAAVHAYHLGETWIGQGSIEPMYSIARSGIERGLNKWGIY